MAVKFWFDPRDPKEETASGEGPGTFEDEDSLPDIAFCDMGYSCVG
jgi:hypothetical protein